MPGFERPQPNANPLFRRDRLVTADGPIHPSDDVLLCDSTNATVHLTAPPAANMRGRQILLMKLNSGGNTVRFYPASGETVNGSSYDQLQATSYSFTGYRAVLLDGINTYGWVVTRD